MKKEESYLELTVDGKVIRVNLNPLNLLLAVLTSICLPVVLGQSIALLLSIWMPSYAAAAIPAFLAIAIAVLAVSSERLKFEKTKANLLAVIMGAIYFVLLVAVGGSLTLLWR